MENKIRKNANVSVFCQGQKNVKPFNKKSMKKFASVLLGMSFVLVVFVLQAQNPHIVGGVKVTEVGNDLKVDFKVAGLGNGTFTFEASVDVMYEQYCTSAGKSRQKNRAGNWCGPYPFSGSETEDNDSPGHFFVSVTISLDPVPPAECGGPIECPSKNQVGVTEVHYDKNSLVITVEGEKIHSAKQLYP